MTAPDISVIMATRNSGRFVAEALTSITGQRHPALEIVVVDAASTDETAAIVSATPGTHLVQQTGSGLWQAWNQAIVMARGEWIAFLDSDDSWEPGALAAHLQAHATQNVVGSIGRTRFFLTGEQLPPGVRPELLQDTHRGPIPGASLLHRSVFDTLGHFPVDYPTAADIEWYLRLQQSGLPIAELDEVVLRKRLRADHLGAELTRGADYDRDVLRIARESLLRRRAAR